MSTEYAVPDVTKSSLVVSIPPPAVPPPFHPNIYGDEAPPPPLPPHPYGTFPNIQVRVPHIQVRVPQYTGLCTQPNIQVRVPNIQVCVPNPTYRNSTFPNIQVRGQFVVVRQWSANRKPAVYGLVHIWPVSLIKMILIL